MNQPNPTSDPNDYLTELERRIRDLPAGAEFVAGEIEAQMHRAGWPPLTEPRIIGPVLMRLRNRGWVHKSGTTSTKARSHGGMASTWRRTTKHGEAAA
ncbi:hypothetical protein [Nocardia fluminea]|uniref:hypothetical protein n=1 Tax=Nocardia fluminea TaxID=134984 RepID=UPI00364F450B